MALSPYGQQVMPVEEFVSEVISCISTDWKTLIESSPVLSRDLDGILREVHGKYKPKKDGEWSAEPAWRKMFAWTACPLEQIRGIFIDMQPLQWDSSSYRSVGCALGVQRRQGPCGAFNILDVPTIRNFLYLTNQVGSVSKWTVDEEAFMQESFRNGFNPLYLSRSHKYLFLQMQLTVGRSAVDDSRDEADLQHAWTTKFVLPLLGKIGDRIEEAALPPIPVVQFYNDEIVEDFFGSPLAEGFRVFRPSFMATGPGPKTDSPIPNIGWFNIDLFRKFITEIQNDRYKKHRKMFRVIHCEINESPEELTFRGQTINRHNIY